MSPRQNLLAAEFPVTSLMAALVPSDSGPDSGPDLSGWVNIWSV